jgi:hypothetical protein
MRLLIIIVVLSFVLPVQAQQLLTIPEGDDVIVPIREKQPAPFDGQLFNNDTALRWGFWLQQYQLRLKSDVEAEQQSCKIQLEYKDKELSIEKSLRGTIETDLGDRLLRAEKYRLAAEEDNRNPPFWKTFQFGLIVGVVVSGTVAALVAWGASLF